MSLSVTPHSHIVLHACGVYNKCSSLPHTNTSLYSCFNSSAFESFPQTPGKRNATWETIQAVHFYKWEDKYRRCSTVRILQFDKSACVQTAYRRRVNEPCLQNHRAAVNQTFPKHPTSSLELEPRTSCTSKCAHVCLCVLSGEGFTSVAVPLCSSWRQGCLPWMGIACCPHTHSAQSPAQTSAPTSPLLQKQARSARTRSLCFWLWWVCAGPFSPVSESLFLARSLTLTLPPPSSAPSSPLHSSLPLLSDSLGCDNPFWQLMLFLGQS